MAKLLAATVHSKKAPVSPGIRLQQEQQVLHTGSLPQSRLENSLEPSGVEISP